MKASKRRLEMLERKSQRQRMFAMTRKQPGVRKMRKEVLKAENGRTKNVPARDKATDGTTDKVPKPTAVKLELEDGSSC